IDQVCNASNLVEAISKIVDHVPRLTAGLRI
ncbi:unnamed protein product, partial [marine sediment metagenome]